MASMWSVLKIGIVHRLPLESGRDGSIHHQFREMRRGVVQRVNACADRAIIIAIAILYGNQGFLQRLNLAAFLARELSPGWVVLFFREHRQDRVSFASRLDNLPLPEIFLGIVVRF